MFKISQSELLQNIITVALFNSNTSASTHYDTLRRTKSGKKCFSSIIVFCEIQCILHVPSGLTFKISVTCPQRAFN